MASITTKKRKNGIKWYVIQNHYNADGERRPIWVPCTDRKEALRLLPEVEDAERQGIAYVRPDDALALRSSWSRILLMLMLCWPARLRTA